MKIGIYPGSFNPLHKGHIAVARFMASRTDLDQVWILVSPLNPFKSQDELERPEARLARVSSVFRSSRKIQVLRIELDLPRPSYTYRTLRFLRKKYPQHDFILILGSDSLQSLPDWKNSAEILRRHRIYVYPRSGSLRPGWKTPQSVKRFRAQRVNVSSTKIRARKLQGKPVKR